MIGYNRHRKEKKRDICILGIPEKEMEQIEEIKYTQRLIEEINRKFDLHIKEQIVT